MMDPATVNLPFRKYLMKYIIPKMSDALVEVSKMRPKDPIEYLVKILMKNNIYKN